MKTIMVTKGDPLHGWPEFYSVTDDPVRLRQDIEGAIDEGDCAPDDVALWEPRKLPRTGTPPKGWYLVALSYHDDEPFEIFDGSKVTQEGIRELLRLAKDSILRQKAGSEWKAVVWRQLNADIEVSVRVVDVRLNGKSL